MTKGRIACRTVIQDWMIPFAIYTAAETPSAFNGPDNPQNCAFLLTILTPRLIMVPWALTSYLHKRHLDWFSRFCRIDKRDQQTDDTTVSVAIGRIYAMHAMRPHNVKALVYTLSSRVQSAGNWIFRFKIPATMKQFVIGWCSITAFPKDRLYCASTVKINEVVPLIPVLFGLIGTL